jgi:hypothetical protein
MEGILFLQFEEREFATRPRKWRQDTKKRKEEEYNGDSHE